MKKYHLVVLAFLLAFTSLGATPLRLARLKVVNKSGMQLEISLTGKDFEYFYYLRVPEGTRDWPAEQNYTLVPDTYSSSVYFVELWDPVYGHECSDKAQSLSVTRDVVMTVQACKFTPPNGGEPPAWIKYGGHNTKRKGR